MEIKKSIGSRLKQVMEEQNIKQVDILEKTMPLQKKYKIKMSKNNLSQYVTDKSDPRQDRIFLLAKALNVSEAWLMGFDVPKERTPQQNISGNVVGGVGNFNGNNSSITINNTTNEPIPVTINNVDDVVNAQKTAQTTNNEINNIQKEMLNVMKDILKEVRLLNKRLSK